MQYLLLSAATMVQRTRLNVTRTLPVLSFVIRKDNAQNINPYPANVDNMVSSYQC